MAKFEDMLIKAQARAKASKKNKEPFVIEIEGETYSIDYQTLRPTLRCPPWTSPRSCSR